MPAKYKLVLRKDMRKDAAEGSKLYYASANTTGTCDVYELCDLISAQSTASSGDVKLQFGSTGTLTEKEFSHALIKSRRIVFRPGKLLKDAIKNYTFEKIASGAPDEGSAGGEDERPGEL